MTLGNLGPSDQLQLPLPFGASRDALDATLDAVRARWGTGAVQRAVHLGHDPGVWAPVLPD